MHSQVPNSLQCIPLRLGCWLVLLAGDFVREQIGQDVCGLAVLCVLRVPLLGSWSFFVAHACVLWSVCSVRM
jgi:hypothetical protein